MRNIQFIEALASSTRAWRDRVLERMKSAGLNDLHFRPSTGMSALGWVLAHQAAVYDFSLNVLILNQSPANAGLFRKYTPGTLGDWDGTPLEDVQQYYDAGEEAFLEWMRSTSDADLGRVIDREDIPAFFRGMTVYEIISNLFSHLNYHTGHLEALLRDWQMQGSKRI
jgi:uncharacterized damage-inducible protein DinB